MFGNIPLEQDGEVASEKFREARLRRGGGEDIGRCINENVKGIGHRNI